MTKSYHILALFPELLKDYFSASLLGKAQEGGLLNFRYHQLRDWSVGNYNQVDDKPYGGGAGMVFLPEVVVPAVRDLRKKHGVQHVVMTSPGGEPLTPKVAKDLSQKDSVLFLCGRFEGIDQRAVDLVVDQEISVGDYVLTGGELAAGVMIDAMARFVPGVVGKEDSVAQDSFEAGLLEHPHYTRPEVFENIPVPEVLLSGHHKNIQEWRRKESLRRTWSRRPDLLKKVKLDAGELEYIKEMIHRSKVSD